LFDLFGEFQMPKMLWRNIPLHILVLDLLESRKGVMLDNDLYGLLEKRGNDISESEINNALMQLEIKGKIIVSNIKKTQRKIELIREGQDYLPVGED
jgi:Fe2+ or Zn2+ uptake regulation protein